jgi:hypothetical protein
LYADLCLVFTSNERNENNENNHGGGSVRAGHREGTGRVMFKSLKLMAKLAKPIKVVLTPEEWGTVCAILKGSKPRWQSIATWANQGQPGWNLVADLDNALTQIDRMLKRRPYGELLFFNITGVNAIALAVQHERRFVVAPKIADQTLSEQRRINLRKVEVILLSVEQKLEALLGTEGAEFIQLGQ